MEYKLNPLKQNKPNFFLQRHYLFWGYFITSSIDHLITFIGLTLNKGIEANPLLAWIIPFGWHWVILVDILTLALFWYLSKVVWRSTHNFPKYFAWLSVLARILAILSWVIIWQ